MNRPPSQPELANYESRWEHVPRAPKDPILGLTSQFKEDLHPQKMNLGVGAFRTEDGEPYVLPVVREAEHRLYCGDANLDKEYISIAGDPDFNLLAGQLLFGSDAKCFEQRRVVSIQSWSGTGSLRLAMEFLSSQHLPPAVAKSFQDEGKKVTLYLPNPSWGNHKNIALSSGLDVSQYTYINKTTLDLDFEGLLLDLRTIPDYSAVLLHVCAHNPTGVDPTKEQWDRIAEVFMERSTLMPIFDSAYQGFATGSPEKDAYSVRLFLSKGIEFMCAQSFAKNLGLYGERIGALHMVVSNADAAESVLSQMKRIVRAMYSSPGIHGARIVKEVLGDPVLREKWKESLHFMSDRISSMRQLLFDSLTKLQAPGSWNHILTQIGMFSYTGLNPDQVRIMKSRYHVYMTDDGRINMCGINHHNVEYFAWAVKLAILETSDGEGAMQASAANPGAPAPRSILDAAGCE